MNFLARGALRQRPQSLCDGGLRNSASAEAVFVRWKTWGTEDDNWLGNELRDTEDD